jgi:hypothetical protein
VAYNVAIGKGDIGGLIVAIRRKITPHHIKPTGC